MRLLVIIIAALASAGCSGTPINGNKNVAPSNNSRASSTPLPVYGYEVVKSYPHDPRAFTQGLFFNNGVLFESTGQNGESTIRRVDLETGRVQQKWDLPRDEFGEGSTVLNDKIYMITWQDGIGRVFDSKDLKLIKEFSYVGEGWGITNDGTNLIMSQGTHVLKFMEPDGFKQVKTLPIIREDGRPLMQINELEYVKGEIWANIWHSEKPDVLGKTNHIARIDPATGKIVGWIDLSKISPDDQPASNDPYDPKAENTLNGIAYDAASDRIFVTGKLWKKLYEIKITGPNRMTEADRKFMARAIELARIGVAENAGGPFGCVVVKNSEIVGEGNNRVTSTNDPTAHAEVIAIRNACEALGSFQLDGCTIYTSCEPCPMCLGAIYWARPAKVFYACTRMDAAAIDFDDDFIYQELEKPNEEREMVMANLIRDEAIEVFQDWAAKTDKVEY